MKKHLKNIVLSLIYIIIILSPLRQVYANRITFTKTEITVGIGKSVDIPYILGNGVNSNDVVWKSSDENVVTVSFGRVTAHKEGIAIITATTADKSVTCKVIVTSNYISVTSISLNKSNIQLLVGESETLNVNITPSNSSNKTATWSSSNNNVVTIDNSGKITAKSAGTATITATVDGQQSICKVTVVYSMSLKSISLNKTNITIKEKEGFQLNVIYNPTTATNKKVMWKSSDEEIVAVNSSGYITAKEKGEATITAVSNDGGYIATCKVVVEEISKKVTGIKLDKTNINMLTGETLELNATIIPEYAENKKIIWQSSDEKIAIVKNGKITALYPGIVEIKAISDDGEKEATCKVTIESPPLEAISFEKEEYTIYVDDELNLKLISKPENAVLENAIWTSSVPGVASIIDGKIKALSTGETIITVSNKDNTINTLTKIIVLNKPKEPFNVSIEGYNLNFSEETLNYILKIGNEKELKINTNVDQSEVTIKGNQNLTKGSIITITYSKNPNVTYVITIQKKQNYTIYIIAIISVLLLINLIRILLKNKKKKEY